MAIRPRNVLRTWGSHTRYFFRFWATYIMSLLILLGLEFLSNLLNQMGPTVSKRSYLNVLEHGSLWISSIFGSFPFPFPPIWVSEAHNIWESRTVYQFNDIKSWKSCPKLASQCVEGPGNHLGTHSQGLGTRMRWKKFLPFSGLEQHASIFWILILLRLEILSNLWNQMGPTVSKWSNFNVLGH